MADIKISQLPQATTIDKNSVLPMVSGSITYKVDLEDINVLQKTKAQIDNLVSISGLIPGQLYKITGVNINLYGGTDILIKAATANTLELAGHGIFYNPKYLNSQTTPNNGYGIWRNYISLTMSSIVGTFTNGQTVTANNGATATYLANGFLSWISGNWSAATSINNGAGATANVSGGVSPSYAIGQNVIWGGKHWTNTSGNVGTATNKYTLSSANWTPVAFNSTNYNVVADVIHYDYSHDMIIRRKDKWNNDVDGNFQVFDEFAGPNGYSYGNPIKDFQWGNGNDDWNTDDYWYLGVQSNLVKDSYLECINFIGSYLWTNSLTQLSYMRYNITDVSSSIEYNTLTGGSRIRSNTVTNSGIDSNILTNSSYINDNTITNSSYINDNTITNSYISNNTLTFSNTSDNTLTSSGIESNTLINNSSIEENTLANNCYIESNTLINNCNIINNTLTNSGIENNTLINNSYIEINTLANSAINQNTLTSSNTSDNTLANSDISNNTLTDSYIEKNTITNGSINSNTLTDSYIENNTLTNSDIDSNTLSDGSFITYNNLTDNSVIGNTTLYVGSSIGGNALKNSVFNFLASGILTTKAIQNIEASYANATFNISGATIIYGNYSKQMFKNSAGVTRLAYYNASNVFTVVNVNA